MSEAAVAHKVALIPAGAASDSVIRIHDTADLSFLQQVELPPFPLVGSQTTTAHGRFVFVTDTLDKVYVIEQADPAGGAVHDFALATVTVQ